MRLLIGIPSTDYMHADFVKSLCALTQHLSADGVRHTVHIENGTLVYMARDKIACKAINEGYTHVLWLDSDMVFTDDVLEDLQFSGQDFVTGIAVSRRAPFASCLFKDTSLEKLTRFGDWDSLPKETFEVEGCGFACVLIATEILKTVQLHDGTCFEPMHRCGEDLAFCRRARALGFHIYAEPAARIGHIGHLTIWPDDCERHRDEWHGR